MKEIKVGSEVRIVKNLNEDDPFKSFGLGIGDTGTVTNILKSVTYPIIVKFDKALKNLPYGLCCDPNELELFENTYKVELL